MPKYRKNARLLIFEKNLPLYRRLQIISAAAARSKDTFMFVKSRSWEIQMALIGLEA